MMIVLDLSMMSCFNEKTIRDGLLAGASKSMSVMVFTLALL